MKKVEEKDPFAKTKDEFSVIIERIKSNSDVGIDTQLTHAIIINYLQQIHQRLIKLEKYIKSKDHM
jgi:hypothetical protein